jgi:hypothetical protein
MFPYLFVFQVVVVSKATDLKTVSGSNKYGVPPFLQLVLDWHKERNMWRIIEIYPDLFVFSHMIQLSFIFHRWDWRMQLPQRLVITSPICTLSRPTLHLSLTTSAERGLGQDL